MFLKDALISSASRDEIRLVHLSPFDPIESSKKRLKVIDEQEKAFYSTLKERKLKLAKDVREKKDSYLFKNEKECIAKYKAKVEMSMLGDLSLSFNARLNSSNMFLARRNGNQSVLASNSNILPQDSLSNPFLASSGSIPISPRQLNSLSSIQHAQVLDGASNSNFSVPSLLYQQPPPLPEVLSSSTLSTLCLTELSSNQSQSMATAPDDLPPEYVSSEEEVSINYDVSFDNQP